MKYNKDVDRLNRKKIRVPWRAIGYIAILIFAARMHCLNERLWDEYQKQKAQEGHNTTQLIKISGEALGKANKALKASEKKKRPILEDPRDYLSESGG